ncbi:hypothetical protein ACFUJX_19735 [Streptomyces rubiginosohelvolus]|uniref:hypothetical protein n=1 Tax=Streptomyces rubiginosohelvolus TaxID=67362 RepID=UPI00363BDDCA
MADTSPDPRVGTLRWTTHRGLDHLWLGKASACGRTFLTLRRGNDANVPYCTTCLAYAQGWLDRHTHGAAPEFGQPDPTGAYTVLDATAHSCGNCDGVDPATCLTAPKEN